MTKSISASSGEIIGRWRYFRGEDGALFRAWAEDQTKNPRTEFVVPAANAEFALRCARISAGLPEREP